MSETVTVALITGATPTWIAATELILNARGLASIHARFAWLKSSINSGFTSVEQRLNRMHADLKK